MVPWQPLCFLSYLLYMKDILFLPIDSFANYIDPERDHRFHGYIITPFHESLKGCSLKLQINLKFLIKNYNYKFHSHSTHCIEWGYCTQYTLDRAGMVCNGRILNLDMAYIHCVKWKVEIACCLTAQKPFIDSTSNQVPQYESCTSYFITKQYTTEGKKEKQGCSRDKLFNSLKVIERSTFYSVYRRYITATWHVDKNRRWFLPYRNSWTYMSACISYNLKIVPFWEISTFSGDISIFHKVNDVLTFLHMLVLEDIGSCKWRVCLIPSNIFFHYKDF